MQYYIATFLTSDQKEVSVRFKEKTDQAARRRAHALSGKQAQAISKSREITLTCTLQKLLAYGAAKPYVGKSSNARVVGLGD
jgi:hypothetical protein